MFRESCPLKQLSISTITNQEPPTSFIQKKFDEDFSTVLPLFDLRYHESRIANIRYSKIRLACTCRQHVGDSSCFGRVAEFRFRGSVIDQRFACFQNLDVDWNALKAKYRPEIANGVSRGRFAAILGQIESCVDGASHSHK